MAGLPLRDAAGWRMSAVLLEAVAPSEPAETVAQVAPAAEVLRIEQLTVSFGAHVAVRGLDLQLAAGEMLALASFSNDPPP